MAILKDPLFSEEARGTIGQLITFKRSKVHPVACAFTDHPVNWTVSKINQAMAWKNLCNQWRALSDSEQATWRDIAPGVLTGFNYFMQCKGALFIDGHIFGWDNVSCTWLKILVTTEGKLIVTG